MWPQHITWGWQGLRGNNGIKEKNAKVSRFNSSGYLFSQVSKLIDAGGGPPAYWLSVFIYNKEMSWMTRISPADHLKLKKEKKITEKKHT